MGLTNSLSSFPSSRRFVITLAIPFSGLRFQQMCTSTTFMEGKCFIYLMWLVKKGFKYVLQTFGMDTWEP